MNIWTKYEEEKKQIKDTDNYEEKLKEIIEKLGV